MKILFVYHGSGIGGGSIHLRNIIKSLPNAYDIGVLCLTDSAAVDFFRSESISVTVLNGVPNRWFAHNLSGKIGLKYSFRYFGVVRDWFENYKLAKLFFRDKDWDIIHIGSHVITSWALGAKKKW